MKISVKAKIMLGLVPLVLILSGFLAYEFHHYWNVRLYNIVGLDVRPSTHYSRLFGFIGEPDRRAPCDITLCCDDWQQYHYDDLGLMFRMNHNGRVVCINIYSEQFRLSGRDRIGVGSSRLEVEQAMSRPTRSKQSQNFWIDRTETAIRLSIDKLFDVRFSFDEDDAVYMIRISPWG